MKKKRNQKIDPKQPTKNQIEIQPSDTLRITPSATDATTLTEEQKTAIRQEQEAVMRQHKGDVLIYYRALSFIAKARAYRPQFKRIDDYAWQVHQIRPRTWHKQMTYVGINEASRGAPRTRNHRSSSPAQLTRPKACHKSESYTSNRKRIWSCNEPRSGELPLDG